MARTSSTARTKVGHDVESVIKSVAPMPLLWFEADKITGVANGVGVQTWANYGTYGATANVTQATAGLRPTFEANSQNGYPGVTFVRASHTELRSAAVSYNPRTMIFVGRLNADDSAGTWIEGGAPNFFVAYSNMQIYGASGNLIRTDSLLTSTVPGVVSAVWNGASSFAKVHGVKKTGTLGQTTGNNIVALGADAVRSGVQWLGGTIYALLLWDTVLTEAQINQIEAAYAAKYNLTAYTLT